jgi:YVTN family beta-propeller protein
VSRTHTSRFAVALTTAGTLVFTLGGLMTFTACSSDSKPPAHAHSASPSAGVQPALPPHGDVKAQPGLPGMPPVLDPNDLYAADRPNQLSDAVKNFPSRVYVPNTESDTVTVIDPATYQVIETIKVGRQPQHVVPSWDLKTLWVNNDLGNTLTEIDPATGKTGPTVDVHDPYNLYFTPDGKYAVVMASADHELVFRDAHTMATVKELPVGCDGVNHADFSPDGRYFIVSCEFDGQLLKVDTEKMEIIARQKLPKHHTMPQDVKISPDGKTWYIADMMSHGIWVLNGDTFGTPKLIPTGKGTHGLYISRDSKYMYVSNRGEGTITLWEFAPGAENGGKINTKWHLPDGGSPDMGGVSADGKVLWLSGRYDSEVYAIDTADGHLIARIKVGKGPHGLAVYPQPGRYSLGHTGIFR